MSEQERPSIVTSVRNFFAYDAPLGAKTRMALRNNLTKMRTRRNCCGNYGEPGC